MSKAKPPTLKEILAAHRAAVAADLNARHAVPSWQRWAHSKFIPANGLHSGIEPDGDGTPGAMFAGGVPRKALE